MPRVCRPGFELEKLLAEHWIKPDAAGTVSEADARGGLLRLSLRCPGPPTKASRGILASVRSL